MKNNEPTAAASIEGLTRYDPELRGMEGDEYAGMCAENIGEYVKFEDIKRLLATQSARQPEFSETDIPTDAPRAFAKRYCALLAENLALKAAAQSAKQGAQPAESNEEVLALHRQLASERLRADRAETRADAKSKECIELRERMAARAQTDVREQASVEQAPSAQEVTQQAAKVERIDIEAISEIADELELEASNYEGDFADTVSGCADALRHLLALTTSTVSASGALAAADDVEEVIDALRYSLQQAGTIAQDGLKPKQSSPDLRMQFKRIINCVRAGLSESNSRTEAQTATDKSED